MLMAFIVIMRNYGEQSSTHNRDRKISKPGRYAHHFHRREKFTMENQFKEGSKVNVKEEKAKQKSNTSSRSPSPVKEETQLQPSNQQPEQSSSPSRPRIRLRPNYKGQNIKRKHEKNCDQSAVIVAINLPVHVRVGEINTLFCQFGIIEKFNVYWVHEKGLCFNAKIFFKEREAAEKAFKELDGANLDGHILKIQFH